MRQQKISICLRTLLFSSLLLLFLNTVFVAYDRLWANTNEPSQSNPILTIPEDLTVSAGDTITIPILFEANGASVTSIFFSIDIDQECLLFDATDADADSIPDAIKFNIPAQHSASATYEETDSDGELDFTIADYRPPLAVLPTVSNLVEIVLLAICEPEPNGNVIADIRFSVAPAPSFSDPDGFDVIGNFHDGHVLIVDEDTTETVTATPTATATATPTTIATSTGTSTINTASTATPTGTATSTGTLTGTATETPTITPPTGSTATATVTGQSDMPEIPRENPAVNIEFDPIANAGDVFDPTGPIPERVEQAADPITGKVDDPRLAGLVFKTKIRSEGNPNENNESQQMTPGSAAIFEIFFENNSVYPLYGMVIRSTMPPSTTFRQAGSGLSPVDPVVAASRNNNRGTAWELPDLSALCPDGAPAGTECIFRIGTLQPGERGELSLATTINQDAPVDIELILKTSLVVANLEKGLLITINDDAGIQITTEEILGDPNSEPFPRKIFLPLISR